MMNFGFSHNQRGIGLAEFLVVVGVLSVIAMGLTTYNETLRRQQVNLTPTASLAALSVSIPYLIVDDASWRTSVQYSGLGCLMNGGGLACPGTMALAVLADASGTVATRWDGSNGIDVTGKPCAGYPSAACPLRYQIIITRLTSGRYPLLEISVDLVPATTSNPGQSWNPVRYSYSNSATVPTTMSTLVAPNRPIRRTAIN